MSKVVELVYALKSERRFVSLFLGLESKMLVLGDMSTKYVEVFWVY